MFILVPLWEETVCISVCYENILMLITCIYLTSQNIIYNNCLPFFSHFMQIFVLTGLIYFEAFKMLASDLDKKLSFNRCIRDGDLVVAYKRHDNMKAVTVSENSVLQNRFGVFKHSDWIGKPFGSKVFSNKGGFVYLLAPTPELWTLVLSQKT